MPKPTAHPRLRTKVIKGRDGRVYVYYFYDMRSDGGKDIPLGADRDEALAKWDEIHNKRPRIKGRVSEAIEAWLQDDEDGLPAYDNKETRRNYKRQILRIQAVFGAMPWREIDMPMLRKYLKQRKSRNDPTQRAPTQANREMAVFQIVWNYAILAGLTKTQWPAAGLERSGWQNEESPREFEVTDALFDAVYAEAEPMLRDCMDLCSATGMRLTDCRTILLPANNVLHLKAKKTGKKADFDLALSQVLPDLLARRRALEADHLMLLSMPDGTLVTTHKLRGAWDRARVKAAAKAREARQEALAMDIAAMVLRDMRKRASDLAEDEEQASALLQHSSVALTRRHYRTRATKLRPVR